jgi:DNA-directed RNA polymerase subunit RPC12/RpoP
MISSGIVCSQCSQPLPPELWSDEEGRICPFCHAPILVKVFPAYAQSPVGSAPQRLAADTEASCFYHPQNRASTPCEECGRFLCSLCTLEIPGAKLCPVCFEASVRGRKQQHFETSRTMHDSIALALATFPAFMIWPVVLTAPLTLFWIVRHWNSPSSILPRTRVRYYLAGLFAVGEIGLVIAGIIAIRMVRR